MIISLIGYRGTGKSTVGRLLAEKLALPFFDSDTFITDAQHRTIADIFANEGESHFRSLETQAVFELMKSNDAVIAWGGGVVLSETNRQAITRSDRTVWLQASAKAIFQRIHHDETSGETRPPLTDLRPLVEIETNLVKREGFYRTCSDMIVDTDHLNVHAIVNKVIEGLSSKSEFKI